MKSLNFTCPGEGSNSMLHKVGEVCVRISNLESGQLAKFNLEKVASTDVVQIRLVGDLQFTDSTGTDNLGENITLPVDAISNNFYVKGVGEGMMFVGNKYRWTGFTIITDTPANVRISFPDADFTYIPNLVRLRLYRPALPQERIDLSQLKGYPLQSIITRPYGGFFGDIANIANADNTSVEIQCQDYTEADVPVTGNLSCFAASTNLTSLKLYFSKVYGDVAALSPLVNLNALDIRETNVSGNLESMLDGMVTAGRNSGTLTVQAKNSEVLLNGDAISADKTVTFSGSGWIIA